MSGYGTIPLLLPAERVVVDGDSQECLHKLNLEGTWLCSEFYIADCTKPVSIKNSIQDSFTARQRCQLHLFFLRLVQKLQVKEVYFECVGNRAYDGACDENNPPVSYRVHAYTTESDEAIALAIEGMMREGQEYEKQCIKPRGTGTFTKRVKVQSSFPHLVVYDSLSLFVRSREPFVLNMPDRLARALCAAGYGPLESFNVREAATTITKGTTPLPLHNSETDQDEDGYQDLLGLDEGMGHSNNPQTQVAAVDAISRVLDPNDPLYWTNYFSGARLFERERDSIEFIDRIDNELTTWVTMRAFNAQMLAAKYTGPNGNTFPIFALERGWFWRVTVPHSTAYPFHTLVCDRAFVYYSNDHMMHQFQQNCNTLMLSTSTGMSERLPDSMPVPSFRTKHAASGDHNALYATENAAFLRIASQHGDVRLTDYIIGQLYNRMYDTSLGLPGIDAMIGPAHQAILQDTFKFFGHEGHSEFYRPYFFTALSRTNIGAVSNYMEAMAISLYQQGMRHVGPMLAIYTKTILAGSLDPRNQLLIILEGPPGVGKSVICSFIIGKLMHPSSVVAVTGMTPKAMSAPENNPINGRIMLADELLDMLRGDGSGRSTSQNMQYQQSQSTGQVGHIALADITYDPETGKQIRVTTETTGTIICSIVGTTNDIDKLAPAVLDRAIIMNTQREETADGSNQSYVSHHTDSMYNLPKFAAENRAWQNMHGFTAYFFGIALAGALIPAKPNSDLLAIFLAAANDVTNADLLGINTRGSARDTLKFEQTLEAATQQRVMVYVLRCGVLGHDPFADRGRLVRFIVSQWYYHTEDIAMWYILHIVNNNERASLRKLITIFKTYFMQVNSNGSLHTNSKGYYRINTISTDKPTTGYNVDMALMLAKFGDSEAKFLDSMKHIADIRTADRVPALRVDPSTRQISLLPTVVDSIRCPGELELLSVFKQLVTAALAAHQAVRYVLKPTDTSPVHEYYVIPSQAVIAKFGFPSIHDAASVRVHDPLYAHLPQLNGAMPGEKSDYPIRCMYAAFLSRFRIKNIETILHQRVVTLPATTVLVLGEQECMPPVINGMRQFNDCLCISTELIALAGKSANEVQMHEVMKLLCKFIKVPVTAQMFTDFALLTPDTNQLLDKPVIVDNPMYMQPELRQKSSLQVDRAYTMFKQDRRNFTFNGQNPGVSFDDGVGKLMYKSWLGLDLPHEWKYTSLERDIAANSVETLGHPLAPFTGLRMPPTDNTKPAIDINDILG